MTSSRTISFLVFSLLFALQGTAQSAFGVTAGAGLGRLFDFRRDEPIEITSKYHIKGGINATAFYQMKNDPFRFEIQYLRQNADLVTTQYAGHVAGTAQNNLSFTLQQLNAKVLRTFEPVRKEHFRMNLQAGAVLGYIFKTRSYGNYSRPETYHYTDTNGIVHNFPITATHTKDESNSSDLNRLNAGLIFGMEFVFPLNEKFDFLLQNRYTVYASNFVHVQYAGWASLLTTELNVGLKYRIP